MAAPLIEIEAVFLAEKIRRDNWIVGEAFANGEIKARIEISGTLDDDDELIPHMPYTLRGRWDEYKGKRQLKFNSYAKAVPYDRAGVVAYLTDAGAGYGFGRVRAAKVWELFGQESVRMMREQPSDVAAALTKAGLTMSEAGAESMADELRRQAKTEKARIHLTTILNGRGFRRDLPKWLIRDFGPAAAEKLAENPFIMVANRYPGCGFKSCDALWLHLKLPPSSIIRQFYCVLHAIESERDGSTWIPRTVAEAALKGSIGSADVRPQEAIDYGKGLGLIVEIKTAGINGPISDSGSIAWLAAKGNAENERELARMIVDAMDEPHVWPSATEIDAIQNIDREQPEVLKKALTGTVAVLGGKPGTGKTRVAANLIKLLIGRFGENSIGIGAPTNLAAQRLSQVMADYGVPIKAKTNHRLLGRPQERGQEWAHHEAKPLPYKVLVIDESSMLDNRLVCSIFKARPAGTPILFIGDHNQLPPVDRGRPFFDMIRAGLPYGELKEIRRNSGGIVEACAAIADGKRWGAGDNLEIIEVDDEEGQATAVLEKVGECRAAGFDPVWDTRIIVAKNETRIAINRVLQGELNPGRPISGTPFRVGDKVISRENEDFKLVEADYDNEEIDFSSNGESVRVSNGELGKVLEIGYGKDGVEAGPKWMIVEVFCPKRIIRVPLGKIGQPEPEEIGGGGKDGQKDKTGTGCAFDLAYAVTFHSSQGSEFPWPILVASTRDGYMGSRELVYTGISRGKVKCKMIGLKAVWDRFCKKVALNNRKTFLRELILQELAVRELAGM